MKMHYWIKFCDEDGDEPRLTMATLYPANKMTVHFWEVVGIGEPVDYTDPRIKRIIALIPEP